MDTTQAVPKVHIREYQPQEIIVAEGAENDHFFVILEGAVEIQQNKKCIRIIKQGDVFGIENHFLKRNYTTKAIALIQSRVASYHISMIREIVYERPQLTEQILHSIMGQLEQTTEVAQENIPLENVVRLNEAIFEKGDIILKEGEPGTEIYRLVESSRGLRVTLKGKEIGRITCPGEYFGEMSAILKEPRSATVSSIGRSIVQVFDGDDLSMLLETYPQFAKAIIKTLARRLAEANKRNVS